MTRKHIFTRIVLLGIAGSIALSFSLSAVFALDGSGTNTVSPTNVVVSSTGNNPNFTFTATETMDSGGLNITVPSGWSAPNNTPGTAGYTTVSSASGIVANVINTLDSATSWSAPGHMTLSADTSDKQEGTGSLANVIMSGAATNEQWYFNYGAAKSWGTVANGTNGQRIGMWIKSSVNTASGDLSWQDDNTASLASPLDTLAIPALTANTWKYTSVTLGAARTAQLSYGLRYTTDLGAATVKLDSVSVLFDAADVNTNWTGDTNITDSLAGSGQEGANSIRCTYAAAAGTGTSGECYRTSTALTILPGNKVSFWVRPSVALNAGDFAWADDNSASLASPNDVVSLPAISANTWTYVTLSIPGIGANSIRSYGLRQVVDKGAMTIDIDAMGSIIDYGDATTGWTAPTSAVQTLSSDTVTFHEGTASLKNILTAGAASGDKWYQTLGATQDWSGYTTIGFWIRSTVAASAGDLKFEYSSASDLGSPIASINLSALSANTWTYQKLTLSGTRTSVNSFGINYFTDIGAATLYIDDILAGPGVPTFPGGGVINTRILSLTSPQTIVVSYGSGGGTSGATAPGTTGNYTFTTQTRISDSGTLTNIASQPVISVDKIITNTALASSQSPEVYGTSVTFTATVTPTSGGAPSGTVTFKDGVTTIGTGTLNGANPGVATYNTSTLSVTGSPHSITAVYNGDATFSGSTSSVVSQTMTAKALTATGMTASNKEYDGGITVTFSGGTLVGIISPDVVSINTRTGSFATKTVGTGKTVNVTSITLTGTDAGNYTVTNPTGITADITTKALTVTGVTANDKPYDGNATAVLNTTSASLVGVIFGDIVTLDASGVTATFDTPDVGLNKPVTVIGLALTGTDGTNYTLTQPTGITASIRNPVPVTTNIVPTSKDAGDPGFTLTVNGSGFISSSMVQFNGESRTTTFVNSGQLTAEILSSDVAVATTSALITVFNPTPGGGTSNAQTFVVVHAATQFVILPPVSGTVDASSTVTVQAQKANGTVDTTYQDDVTLNTSGSAIGGGLVNIMNGVGTISISDTVAQTVHLTLTDSQATGLSVTSSQDLVFAPGAVAQFVLNSPGNMDARTRLGYQVTRKDQYGNAVSAGTLTAYLYSSSLSADHKFYDDPLLGSVITSLSFTDGSATANFWYYDDMPGTYTITVSDNTPTADGLAGIDDATRDVTVVPVAVKFVISTATSTSVDFPLTVTVEAQKVDNSVDTSFQDDVTLNTTGSATGAGVVDIINGIGTKQISNMVAESITLSLADSQSTGLDISSNASVTWTGGVITQFSLNHPGSLSAGNRASYTVSRKDQYGNYTSLGDTTAYLYSSGTGANKKFYDAATGGNIITSITIPAGSQSIDFWYYDETPGFWSITASDNSSAPNGATGISDSVDVLSVTPGTVGIFILNNPGNMTASTRLGYTVVRKDQFGNLVTNGDTTTYLFTTAGALGSGRAFYDAATLGNSISSITIGNGSSQALFWYYEETAGSYTVTASDNAGGPDGAAGIFDGTMSVIVHPAPIVATKFVIIPSAGGTVDSPVTITIQAQDNAGNIDTSATSSVTLVTDGSATGAGLVTMMNGVGTIQISDHNAETVHLSLSDTQGTGLDVSSAQDVVFGTGGVSQFTVDNPGDIAAGSRLGFTVTRKDQFGNLITSGVTTVYLYSSSVGVNKKFYDASSGGSTITSVNILGGQSTAQFWYYDELAGSVTVTSSDSASAPDGAGIADATRTFAVTSSAIAKFTLNNPGNMTAGTRLEYTITRKDTYDNPVTSGIVSAYLYSNASSTSAKFYDVATGGFPTTLVAFADGSSQTHFWYYDEAPGTWVITASDSTPTANGAVGVQDAADSVTVTLATITATRFVIQPVSDSTINIPVTVTIRAEDDNGNVDATYNHNVTLVTSGSATGGGLVTIVNGVGTATINDAVAETISLSLLDSQTTGLNISSSQSMNWSTVYIPPAITNISGGASGIVYYAPIISGVHLAGKAFPGALLNIVAIGGTGTLQDQKGVATANGNFSISSAGLSGGARSYGIIGTDQNNNTTQVKIFDANMANSLLQLDVNGILLSPTLGLSRSSVTKGDVLGIIGAGAPSYKIEVQVDNLPTTVTATVDSKGMYKALVPTSELNFGSHTIRTRQISSAGLKSDYSPQEVFSVVNIFTPNMDFNNDGTVGIQDWSMFVARWQSTDQKLRAKDDLNGDGKVDVQDLSIFVRTLKVK